MSTYTKVDPSTLGWVKHEIDETLKQARLALESFAENPGDSTRLRFCATHLHQVVGTLMMVELDGAATLAHETEALAGDILNDKVKPSEDTLEILTRGILVLPDYLGRLQLGQPDVPLRHLSLINEMRAARGSEPLAEADLFFPDFSVRPPGETAKTSPSEAEYSALAKRLRSQTQAALLEWLRDIASKDALGRIGGAFEQLQSNAGFSPVEQLFWIAGALVEGLIDDGIEPTNERKRLFARLDQQVKKLTDGVEKPVLRNSSEALARDILLEVGRATSSGPKVTQIKRAFNLDQLLATGLPGDLETHDLPVPEVLQSVATALAKEIETAKDVVTSYFESDKRTASSLEPLLEQLHEMSGTLDMLGVPILKALVDELAETARAIIEERIANPDAASMPMAQALLLIENGARDIHKSGAEWKRQVEHAILTLRALNSSEMVGRPVSEGIEVSDAELTESEYSQLLGMVASEVGVNLSKIEEALESFAANPDNTSDLEEIPQYLSQVEGALQILGLDRASELASVTRRHIEAIRERTLRVDDVVLDGLAVCVGTIGAYVEGLRAGRRNVDDLASSALREMNVAVEGKQGSGNAGRAGTEPSGVVWSEDPTQLLADIRSHLDSWLAGPENREALQTLHQELEALARIARADGHPKVERISSEMNNLLHLVDASPGALSDDIAATLNQSFRALEAMVDQGSPASASVATDETGREAADAAENELPETGYSPVPEAPPLGHLRAESEPEFDEEIVQIFIEDAREVLEMVRKEFSAWRTDVANKDALAEVRRGFHTLKGSGRMVGTTDISELAWAIENLLNKVREGKIHPSEDIFALVEQAQEVLPRMVEHLAGGPPVEADIDGLRASADSLAQGKTSGAPGAQRKAPNAGVEEDLPKLDGTLLEIFTNEAQGHLETLRKELAACRDTGDMCLVSEALFRATHTLAGNARSLGLHIMSEACGEAEKLLYTAKDRGLSLTREHLDLVGRLEAAIGRLIHIMNGDSESSADLAALFSGIADDFRDASPSASEPAAQTLPGDSAPTEIAETVRAADAERPEVEAVPAAAAIESAGAIDEGFGDQVDPELLEIFHEEAVDILGSVEESLAQWRAYPQKIEALHDLKRALHTLKGGARMAGLRSMGSLSHNTETLVKHVEDGKVALTNEVFDLLEESHDNLVTMLDRLQSGQPLRDTSDLNERLLSISGGATLPAVERDGGRAAVAVGIEVRAMRQPDTSNQPAETPFHVSDAADTRESDAGADGPEPDYPESDLAFSQVAAADPLAEAIIDRREIGERDDQASLGMRDRRGQVRVHTSLLNDLVNFAGEVSISRARMEQQIYGFRDNLAELNRNVTRFREQIRELEIQSESQILYRLEQQQGAGISSTDFDPLEFDRFSRLQQLSRSLTESLHDLATIQNSLGNFVGEAETVLQQQARINTDLQEGLMRTRMIRFSTQGARLRHIVRQTSRELGKRAELRFTGSDVEIDRTVLERMIGPFEHMIRNSLDHGIESEVERKRKGKPAVGQITIATSQEGSEIVIQFVDDGAGLNTQAIREKAIERNLMAADAHPSEEELIQFILMSGFSTATKVTQVSGRGVGMDVVHNEVKQLGGTMSVDSKPGEGTTFIIRLPLTLSITQALMVYVGDQMLAMPLASVSNIIEYSVDKLNEVAMGRNPLLNYQNQVYPYMSLAARLGITPQTRSGRKVPVVLARTGTREVAIQVDGLGGTREIVIKSLGPQLMELKGIAGATIQGDGRVILILDVPGLWYTDDTIHVERGQMTKPMPETRERPIVMVVDDSLTVRKVTGRHLQKRGMDVMVAKDGIDAVDQLRERVPDLMLVDIEMPRMDGYELTTRVRSDENLKHIPIIMITSRAGSKHRDRAFQIGVDMYMSKPYQEEELLTNVEALMARGRAR